MPNQAAFQKIKSEEVSNADVVFKQDWPTKLAMILNNRNFKGKYIFHFRKQTFFFFFYKPMISN